MRSHHLPSPSRRSAKLRFFLTHEIRGLLRSPGGLNTNRSEIARKRGVIRSQKKLARDESSAPLIFDAEHRAFYRTYKTEYQHAIQFALPFAREMARSTTLKSYRKNLSLMRNALMKEFGEQQGQQFNRMIQQEYPELKFRPPTRENSYFSSAEEAVKYAQSNEEYGKTLLLHAGFKSRDIQEVWEASLPLLVNRLMRYDPTAGTKISSYFHRVVLQSAADYLRESGENSRTIYSITKKVNKQVDDERKKGRSVREIEQDDDTREKRLLRKVAKRERVAGLNAGELSDRDVSRMAEFIDKRSEKGSRIRVLREELNAAMKFLTSEQRKLIRMHYIEDMSLYKIGRKIGKSESRVSKIMQEAIGILRNHLSNR